jgi:hypothetical protein
LKQHHAVATRLDDDGVLPLLLLLLQLASCTRVESCQLHGTASCGSTQAVLMQGAMLRAALAGLVSVGHAMTVINQSGHGDVELRVTQAAGWSLRTESWIGSILYFGGAGHGTAYCCEMQCRHSNLQRGSAGCCVSMAAALSLQLSVLLLMMHA